MIHSSYPIRLNLTAALYHWLQDALSGVVVLACGLDVVADGPDSGVVPAFRNWPQLYREGLVDGAEWRAHRFEWF